jgi:hypothetical protein
LFGLLAGAFDAIIVVEVEYAQAKEKPVYGD